MIDQEVRALRYRFFKLCKFEQLQLLIKYHLIDPKHAELIPLEFFTRGFERAVIEGGADRLADDPWIKEQK